MVDEDWTMTSFQQQSPIGYCYPTEITCPPVNSSQPAPASRCSLGNAPVYTVNATTVAHVVSGVVFAEKHNVRLVIRNTGHDLLDRSTGFGSMHIWIKYLRTGIVYHEQYSPSDSCSNTNWSGSAFSVGGGYIWSDVYPEAWSRNLIVVGGGSPVSRSIKLRTFIITDNELIFVQDVGVIGGWMQGGGHGPASHDFGLGADQVLEATVVLVDGTVITANPCQHPDLYFAIRGGGPGTCGIVVSATIKAYPTRNVTIQTLALAPLSDEIEPFMEAVTELYAAYPSLVNGGFSGYGSWTVDFPFPLFASFGTAYVHTIAITASTQVYAASLFDPVLTKLQAHSKNGTALFIDVTYATEPDYASYYNAYSGARPPVGSISASSSRLLGKKALTANRTALLNTLYALAGTSDEGSFQSVEIIGGGAVFNKDPLSGLNPVWRRTYIDHIVSRSIATDASAAEVQSIRHDITYVKGAALKSLAPDMGAYMNEADLYDPDWAKDFYGGAKHRARLQGVKDIYDPKGVLWCGTCVGSEKWSLDSVGRLC